MREPRQLTVFPAPLQTCAINRYLGCLFRNKPAVLSFVRRVIMPLLVDESLVPITAKLAPVLFSFVIDVSVPHPSWTAAEVTANKLGAHMREGTHSARSA